MKVLIALLLLWPWGPWRVPAVPTQPAPVYPVIPVYPIPSSPPAMVRRGVFGRTVVVGQDGRVRVFDRFGRQFAP